MESNTGVTGWSGFSWTGSGCSLRAPSTAVFRPIVGVAKSKRKNVVNIWMIITLVVASMIVVADGFVASAVTEREVYWNGPLEYQPSARIVWFAAASLLLMFRYVRKVQVALAEGLFLWFVFCTTAYTRDFACSRWPGIPLFENSRNHGVALAWIVVLAEIAFCFYGAANLLLESPFLAALFCMGLGLSMTRLLDRERLCGEAFS